MFDGHLAHFIVVNSDSLTEESALLSADPACTFPLWLLVNREGDFGYTYILHLSLVILFYDSKVKGGEEELILSEWRQGLCFHMQCTYVYIQQDLAGPY